MARSRNIKPGFFINEELSENDPLGRLLFIGLWTIADYKGDLEWRPKRIKAQVLPYDDCDIIELMNNLDKSRLVTYYSLHGIEYIHINNFSVHQNPHPNERRAGSEIPGYIEPLTQANENKEEMICNDKSRLVTDYSITNHADSLIPHPDSLILIPSPTQPESKDLFISFWENYPKKSDRKKAQAAFNRLSNEKKELAINDCKTRYMQTDKKFIPLATTYIHGERWDDEVEQTKKQNNHTGFADKNYQAGATKPEDISWLND